MSSIHHIQFGNEFDELLNVSGAEADPWLARIKALRWFGPFVVLLWVVFTHRAVPSDKGLMVLGKQGTFRLGDFVLSHKPEWRHVMVIWLKSERQKAWLHGCTFNTTASITPQNQDDIGREIE